MTTEPAMEAGTTQERAVAAAAAAAAVLPSVEPLTPAGAQPGGPHVAAAFAGAAITDLDGVVSGRIGLLVAADLVEALAASPIQGLDLAAATQPALDAVAAALGAHAGAARTVAPAEVADEFAAVAAGAFTAVPLIGAGIAAAVLIPDALLQSGAATTPPAQPVQAVEPGPATPAGAPTPAAGAAGASAGFVPGNTGGPAGTAARGIEMLHGVVMDVTVEIGRTRMTVRDLLALSPGTVLELDRAAGSPADLLVNGRLIARGEVVVVDEDFGLRVTEIVDDSSTN